MSDKEILLKRYYVLDYIWEYKGITCPLITHSLTGINYVKKITKELKAITSWDQNDTQSSTANDCCTPKPSIAESVVSSITKKRIK